MKDTIYTALPWLALGFALLGIRDLDPAIPVSLLALIFLFWAINWLAHHVSLPWRRYLRTLFWVLIIGTIIAVPELRTAFQELVGSLIALQSSTLIVLALATLIVWGVLCLTRPAAKSSSR